MSDERARNEQQGNTSREVIRHARKTVGEWESNVVDRPKRKGSVRIVSIVLQLELKQLATEGREERYRRGFANPTHLETTTTKQVKHDGFESMYVESSRKGVL